MAWAGGRAHQPKPPPGVAPPAVFSLIAKMQFSLPSWSWVPGMNPGSFPAHASLGPPPSEVGVCAKTCS